MKQASYRRRRPPRRQPHRNCKRLRYENGSRQPCLQELPDDVLRPILGFTLMDPEESDNTEVWRWAGHLSRVCRGFRRVVQELAPRRLYIGWDENSERTDLLVSLIHSIRDNKGTKLELIDYKGFHSPDENPRNLHYVADNRRILEALRSLFEKPGALPNLLTLWFEFFDDGGVVDIQFLFSIARNLPSLTNIALKDGYLLAADFRLGERVSPEQFGTFGEMIKGPLEELRLTSCFISCAHLEAFLRVQGPNLYCLAVDYNFNGDNDQGEEPDSLALSGIIAEHCNRLEILSIRDTKTTSSGLKALLQANSGINDLWLSHCSMLGPDLIDILVQHAPQLANLDVQFCNWFTNDCLKGLVQGQIDYCVRNGSQEIPLVRAFALGTGVTAAGLADIVSKPHVGHLCVELS